MVLCYLNRISMYVGSKAFFFFVPVYQTVVIFLNFWLPGWEEGCSKQVIVCFEPTYYLNLTLKHQEFGSITVVILDRVLPLSNSSSRAQGSSLHLKHDWTCGCQNNGPPKPARAPWKPQIRYLTQQRSPEALDGIVVATIDLKTTLDYQREPNVITGLFKTGRESESEKKLW